MMASRLVKLLLGGMWTWLCVFGEYYYVAKDLRPEVKYEPLKQEQDYHMIEKPLPGASAESASTSGNSCANCTFPGKCILGLIPTCITLPPSTCAPGACTTTKTTTATSTKVMTTTSTGVTTSTSVVTQTVTHPVTRTSTAHTTLTSRTTATDTTTATKTTTQTHTATSTHVTTATTTATVDTTHTTTSTGTKTSVLVVPSTQTHYTTETLTATSTGIVDKTVLTTATDVVTSTSTHTTTQVHTTTATETLRTTATHLTTDTITATSTQMATSTKVETQTKTDSVTNTQTETTTQTHHTTATKTLSKTLTQTRTSTEVATSILTSCSVNCPDATTIVPTTTVYATKVVTSTATPTPPPPPPKPPAACKAALDIGVVIDASDSVNPEDFQVCLQFVANLTDKFQVSAEGTHFGAIVYSSNPQLEFTFGDSQYYNPVALKAKIMTFERIATGTRTDLALQMANNDLFSVAGGQREQKPKTLIVITDGRTDPARSSPYPSVLEPLQEKNVKIISVGVGLDVLQSELVEIANGKAENVFTVDNYDGLVGAMEKILNSSCVTVHPVEPTPPVTGPPVVPTAPPEIEGCSVKYTKLGCFKDKKKSRALPELLLNERGSIDFQNWQNWLPGFICRCAEKTKGKGYHMFGAQHYGECWSGPEAGETYKKHGPSSSCVDKALGECVNEDIGECAGGQNTNYIYELVIEERQPPPPLPPPIVEPTSPPTTAPTVPPVGSQCNVKFNKIGCFKDNRKKRALGQLIHNERGSIPWNDWTTWLPGFICRCAEKTKENNFFYFGAQYYGECWSDPEGGAKYNRHGPADTCVDTHSQKCTAETVGECVGEKNTNYVYEIVIEGNPEEESAGQTTTTEVEYEACHVQFDKAGCYADDLRNPRPMDELLFTDRDKKSSLYSGIPIDWGNWDSYIEDLVCRCAENADGKKYSMFGIENFGECWSGDNAVGTYNRAGPSNLCVTTEYGTCDAKNDKACVGNATALFAYNIAKEEVVPCYAQFENVGCFKDNNAGGRPLPELLFTDVDSASDVYTGISVEWGQLDRYLADVACRCAEYAAEYGYEYFGIQNYGQCYSGRNAAQTYQQDGASDQCVHEGYQPCPPNAVEETCVGKENANYVYRVVRNAYRDNSKHSKAHTRPGKIHRRTNAKKIIRVVH